MPEPTLRERRKDETRRLLEESARHLFAEKGFRATSVDEIASAAGVSRTTFFRYFSSKDAVVFGEQERTTQTFWRLLSERPAAENSLRAFEEAIVGLARATAADEDRKQRALELWALYAANPELRARLFENREANVAQMARVLSAREGLEEPTPVHMVTSAVAMQLMQQVNEEWQRANGKVPAEGLIRERFRLLRELTAG